VLANEFNVEVIEYKPHNQYLECDAFDTTFNELNKNTFMSMNQIESFKQFVWNLNHYKQSLNCEPNDGVMSTSNDNQSVDRLRKLILIEEFPYAFHLKPESLHNELRILAKRFGKRCIPIVFIISETINGHSDEYKLLPKTIQTELNIKTITFKEITETSLHKILSKLCDYQLTKDEIQKIIDCSSGDIRSAINNMHLKYMHLFDDKPNSLQTKSKKLKKLENNESDVDFGGRDTSLTLIHGIGKILYAKRIDTTNEEHENLFKMPEHLSSYERKPLIENAENITEKLIVSSDVLNGWLHENYLDFVDNIECAEKCIDWLRETDFMFSGQDLTNKTICDSYQSSLATRGLMFNLNTRNCGSSDSKETQTNESPHKSNRKFKAFVKPQIAAINRSSHAIKHQICQSIPRITPFLTTDTLILDYMPFISQMPNRLREVNPHFRNVLNKIVNYDDFENQINETELCNAFSQSSVSFDSNFFKPVINEENSEHMLKNINSENEDNYEIETDSD
jgi:DNA polymerase III delta prime subunit